MYEITRGKIEKPQKVVIYGPEGIGKTTLASEFPHPLFIDTEEGTGAVDVARLPAPTSWAMLMDEVKWVRDYPEECGGTLVIDTADWAERLCIEGVCKAREWKDIEAPGYGKGYTVVKDEFGKLLNLLSEVVDRGLNVVVTAHAAIVKFEEPDQAGAYDRWELKLTRKQVAPMLKEWADAVLFCNYKTIVVTTDKDGKKGRAQGGRNRVIHTTHAATWDAKNRWCLPDEVPMDWSSIAAHVPVPAFNRPADAAADQFGMAAQEGIDPISPEKLSKAASAPVPFASDEPASTPMPAHMLPILDLMRSSGISSDQLSLAMHERGYLPADTPLANWPVDLAGKITAVWPQVVDYINSSNR